MIIQHNTGKAELCFVRVPGNSFNYVVRQMEGLSDLWYESHYGDSDISNWIELPPDNWQIVGNPFELSQEVIKELVPEMRDIGFPFEVQDMTDIWRELLVKWKIYPTNPFGTKRYLCTIPAAGSPAWLKSVKDWQDAEEHTGSFILLKKI